MKKSMYVFVMLMLGLSCALWTGCSDDDDNAPKKEEGNKGEEGKDDGTGEKKDTVYLVKTITTDQKSYTLGYADKRVNSVVIKAGVNQVAEAKVEYQEAAKKVVITYKDYQQQSDMKATYTLSAKGYTETVVLEDCTDPEDVYEYATYEFTNNADGMLETIAIDGEEYYMAVFAPGTKNWKAIASMDMGTMLDCTPGKAENNYSVDLNELLYCMDIDKVIDFAILCQLIAPTENILVSLSGNLVDEGEEEEEEEVTYSAEAAGSKVVIDVVTTPAEGQVNKIELKVAGQVAKTIQLGY